MTAAHRLLQQDPAEDRPLQRAIEAIRVNKRCEAMFGAALSGNPAWPLMLELFVHRAAGIEAEEDMIVSAGTPRYRRVLEQRGLIGRDTVKGSLALTDHGFQAMRAVLSD